MNAQQIKKAQRYIALEADRTRKDKVNLMVSKGYSVGAAKMLVECYIQSLTSDDDMLRASAAPVRNALWQRLETV